MFLPSYTQLCKDTLSSIYMHTTHSFALSLSFKHNFHLNWLSMRVPFSLAFFASSSACVKRSSIQITNEISLNLFKSIPHYHLIQSLIPHPLTTELFSVDFKNCIW